MKRTTPAPAVLLAVFLVAAPAPAQEGAAEQQIAQLAAARHEGKENGWQHLQRALAAVEQAQREDVERAQGRGVEPGSIVVSEMLTGPLPRQGLDEGLWYLGRVRELGAFGALLDLARVGQAWRPPEEAGQPADMLERTRPLGKMRELARIAAASMRLAAVEADADEQVAMFDAMLALAAVAADNLTVLDRLVAVALANLALGEARYQLGEGLIDGATAQQMLEAIDARPLAPVEASRRAEALHIVGMMQEMAAEEMAGLDGDELTDAVVEASRADGPAPDEPEGDEFEGDEFDRQAAVQFLGQQVRDSVAHALQVEPQVQMYRDATRIALALEIHRSREGAHPEAVDALAPGILPEVPKDALSGLPFGYRRLEAPDAHGRRYLLWSAGADGEDNGGRIHPESWHLAQTEAGAGFDIPLNHPRRQ
jgi:hypothetical protein